MTMDTNHSIKALEGYDSGVYLDWLEAVGDVMMGGSPLAKGTVEGIGGLILALSAAAKELQERELAERKGG